LLQESETLEAWLAYQSRFPHLLGEKIDGVWNLALTREFAEPRYWVDEKKGRKAVIGKKGEDEGQVLDYQGYRLGFRDIARNTDKRTMIATVLPPKIFTGNTLIISKFPKNLAPRNSSAQPQNLMT